MTTAKRKLTIENATHGTRVLDMPATIDIDRAEAATAWFYFIGALSSASVKDGWSKNATVRKSIPTVDIIELLESAAAYAREEAGK